MKIKSLAVNLLPLLFLIIYSFTRGLLSNRDVDRVVFLDVGAGDSIIVQSNSKYLLIDGGSSYYTYQQISKYIQGIKPIVVIATHMHSDHISGLNYILRSLIDYDVFANKSEYESYHYTEFRTANYSGMHDANTNTSIIFENFNIDFLWPYPDCQHTNLNYCSSVILLTHTNGEKVLLMSDSEVSAQQRYLSEVPRDISVIKIPHQGSKDALYKPLIQKANPKVAVLSIGENTWGHPHKEVIDFYKQMGIKIYRTDYDGDVIVNFEQIHSR